MPASDIALDKRHKSEKLPAWLTPALLGGILLAVQAYDHTLFHFLAESFNASVVTLVAVIGWQAYRLSGNRYLAYVAAGYFWVALLDMAHAVTYAGMGVLPGDLSNVSLQFWLVAVFLEAMLLVTAPFLSKRLNRRRTILLFGAVAMLPTLLIFNGLFPIAFVGGQGPTPFKIGVEYAVMLLLFLAVVGLQAQREQLDKRVVDLMSTAMVLIAGAEFAFTNYVHFGQWQTVVGHGMRFVAYWLIYAVMVRMSLTEPFRALAHGATTFDAIPDPTVILDEQGIIRRANRAARTFLGGDEATFIGQHCHGWLHAGEVDRTACPVCQRLAAGLSATDLEVELKARGQWHHVSLAPISPGEGVAGSVHVNRDVTQRKVLETALQQSEARYRGLIETTSDWVWEVDQAGLFTYVSPRVVDTTGYEADEMVGRPIGDFMEPAEAAALTAQLLPLVGQRAPFKDLENTLRHKSGRAVVVETTGAPYFEGALFRGYRGISRDVTARKETEGALRRSEYTYRTLVENLPQYVFLKDTDSRLISCNHRFAALLGAVPEQITGKSVYELHDRDLAERFCREDARIVASRELEEYTDTYVLNGRQLAVHIVKSPVVADGQVIGILGIFWDVTEKKIAEDALRETQWRYQAILQNASDAILVANHEGRFIDGNRRAEELFGYTREEFLRMSMPQIHAPDNADSLRAAVKQMNETGASLFEHRMLRKDGTVIDVEASGTRIPYGDSHILLGNFRDISQRKRVESELANYRDHLEYLVEERTRELRVMNAELEAFSYSVSHDLRSPLRAINGYGEALREDLAAHLAEDSAFYLDRMRAATIRMEELIDGLLNLSQVIRRELTLNEVDLSALAQGVAASIRESDPDRRVTFDIGQHLTALGDATLLRVLLENLLNNAWKFTARREDAVIAFGREVHGGAETFYVRDNGAGFDMQFAHKLFKPFERLHADGEFQGTGIGLATVRRIVERHGGRVWAEGDLGHGASIYFSLAAKDA